VISGRTEVEMEPAVSMLAMHLPGVRLFPFYVSGDDTASLKKGQDLLKTLDIYPNDRPKFLCLADPMTADVTRLLDAFNDGYRGLPVVGGLASGGVMGAANWLCLNGRVYRDGAVGVAMTGDIEFETVVSQGCRPIGKPFVMTRAEGNVLYELAGRPALAVIRELIEALSPKDRSLAEHSLSVGIAMDEKKMEFKRGDFLIRNIMGFDPDNGSLMIGAILKVGQTLQFQLRDAETSDEDLKHLLANGTHADAPRGGILVSCCGRGRNFYGHPDHDAAAIQGMRGPLPLTGFFANGEIGPIGAKNYVHGYTSSLVILR
jgi:small ligand-binding sensory domain FIST